MPALLTPLTPDGQVNQEMLAHLANKYIELGFHGLYLCGSTGEGLLLAEEERKTVVETTLAAVKGRIPVIVHVGDSSQAKVERLARHAEEVGADAVASIPPFYYQYTREEIMAYYQSLKSACGLPLYVYNIPSYAKTNLDIGLAHDLFSEGVIQGMKYTHHDLLTLQGIMSTCHGDLNVFSGPDDKLLPFLVMGVDGGIGTTYNCMPRLFLALYQAWQDRDLDRARELQLQANRVISVMTQFSIIPALKAVMGLKGLACGTPRRPFLPLSEEQTNRLERLLREVGFFTMERDFDL
jgi:N-acetylneuraminate lyase